MNDICGYCLDKEATMKRFFDICNFYDIKNKDLVKLFNVSNVIVSYWRNGSRFPGWDKLMVFAYTVGLPLEVMIIGKEKIFWIKGIFRWAKEKIENNQIKGAIVRIDELKEKKYISILQELLDSGKLDNPPKIEKVIFNPLSEETDIIDLDSSKYAKLIADVKYYGLTKRRKVENCNK